jgi:hypothetical protein
MLEADGSDSAASQEAILEATNKAKFKLKLLCDMSRKEPLGIYLSSTFSGLPPATITHTPLQPGDRRMNFPNSARDEWCAFCQVSRPEIVAALLRPIPSSTSDGVKNSTINIYTIVKDALSKESDEVGRSRTVDVINQFWPAIVLFFKVCEAPGDLAGLAAGLVELITSELVVTKLMGAFPDSATTKFISSAKEVLDIFSQFAFWKVVVASASGGDAASALEAGGDLIFPALISDFMRLEALIPEDNPFRKQYNKAKGIVSDLFEGDVIKLLSEPLTPQVFFSIIMGKIFGGDILDKAAGMADKVSGPASGMLELKHAFKLNGLSLDADFAKFLLPRLKRLIGLPSGLKSDGSEGGGVAAQVKFLTESLGVMLRSEDPTEQVALFVEHWGAMIADELPKIIDDILAGFPAGQSPTAERMWKPIKLPRDALAELEKVKQNITDVVGKLVEVLVTLISAVVQPVLQKVGFEALSAIVLGLQIFQAILLFVQGGGADAALKLAYSIGLKFGLDRNLLDGLLKIVTGNFDAKAAKQLAPAIMGKSDSARLAAEALGSLIGVAQGDLSQIKPIAMKLGGFNEEMLNDLMKGITRLKPILEKLKAKAAQKGKKIKGTIKLSPNDKMDPVSLFTKYDVDKSGALEFEEFFEILKLLNYPKQMKEAAVMSIFVNADNSKTGSLNMTEFKKGLQMDQDRQSSRVLELMGLSPKAMIGIVLGLLGVLLILFGFIFMGIAAFSTAGGFAATVNSSFPVMSGVGASSGETPGDADKDSDEVGEVLGAKLNQADNEGEVAE